MTTGATLDACSRALKLAGAESVVGLTVARVTSGLGLLPAPKRAIEPVIEQVSGNLQTRN